MHHVIIGGGPAATNASRRSASSTAAGRPSRWSATSRRIRAWRCRTGWRAAIPEVQTHTGDAAYFARLEVATRFGVRATAIDPQGRTVTLSDGSTLAFDNLLIATGSSPLRPSIPGADLPGVEPLWSLAHTDRVLKYAASLQPAGRTPRVVLVGAGFIGIIVLNAMHKRQWQLAVVEREAQVLPRMLDAAGRRPRAPLAGGARHSGALRRHGDADPAAGRRGEDGRTVRWSVARGRHRDPGDRHPAEPRPAPGIGNRHRRGDPGQRPDADELPARLRGRRRGTGPGAASAPRAPSIRSSRPRSITAAWPAPTWPGTRCTIRAAWR